MHITDAQLLSCISCPQSTLPYPCLSCGTQPTSHQGARVILVGEACDAKGIEYGSSFDDGWLADYYTSGGSGRVVAHPVSIAAGLRSREDITVTLFPHDDVQGAINAMRGHDVAIACGGGMSTEGADRCTLRLDQDDFLKRLANNAAHLRQIESKASQAIPPLVIVALAPGVILTEWSIEADAALAMFLPGEQAGNAAADVLLGDLSPSGRLPVSLPVREEDVQSICRGKYAYCTYEEGLRVGWRGLIGKPVAYPFGHGLSYGWFDYSWVRRSDTVVTTASHDTDDAGSRTALSFAVRVTNWGNHPAEDVVQLYLAYPKGAGEPDLVLRDFAKTPLLQPGSSSTLTLSVTHDGLSVWRTSRGEWEPFGGRYVAWIGASSRNLSLAHNFDVHAKEVGSTRDAELLDPSPHVAQACPGWCSGAGSQKPDECLYCPRPECPGWCADWKCDGASWCLHGQKPESCTPHGFVQCEVCADDPICDKCAAG